METYARIENNKVLEIISHDETLVPFNKLYTPEVVSSCVLITNPSITEGWGYKEGQFYPPSVEVEPLDIIQERNLLQVEKDKDKFLERGFIYGTDRIQADPVAQQNATGFLTAISAGVPVPFPIEWRTKANTTVYIQTLDEFRTFAAMMLQFVQTVFHDTWNVKDLIRAATAEEDVTAAVTAFRAKYALPS